MINIKMQETVKVTSVLIKDYCNQSIAVAVTLDLLNRPNFQVRSLTGFPRKTYREAKWELFVDWMQFLT